MAQQQGTQRKPSADPGLRSAAQFDLDGISLTCDGVVLPVPAATGAEDSIIASSTVGSATLDAEYGRRREMAFAAALVEAGVRIGDESTQIKDEAAPEPNSAGRLLAASSGGPDAGGYTFIDSDEPGGPFFDWIDIATTGTNLGLGDDSHYFPVGLPFNFDFYGVNYNQLAVGSNGTVYFEDDYLGLGNVCIPGTNGYGVERFIAVYWDDLYPSGSDNVYYQIVGSAPNRVLVVQWQNVRHYGSSTNRVTAQVQLSESPSDILLLYANPSSEAGSGATVGIQKDTATGLQYLCNQSRLHSNLAVLFTQPHTGTCPTSYDVYLGTDANDMNLIDADINEAACDPTPEPAGRLDAHTTYFWQVIAKNATGETAGPNGIDCWHFTTENTPPAADAGPDQNDVEGQCNTPQGTQVTLDGSGSYDEDGDTLTYTWIGPFVESPVNGSVPTVTLSDGCPDDYIINLDVNDGYDDANDQVIIRVVDTTPPEFNLSVSPTILWPPNHKLWLITPEWTLHDNCDELPDVSLVNIVINEGDETDTYDPLFDANPGDGHTVDDIQVHTDGSIYLRAERSGTGTGRVYTITYQAVDDSGNVTRRSAVVVVPHDQSAASTGPDVNADGVVNLKDFAEIARYWLQNEPSVDITPLPSGDGIVNGQDLAVLMQQWMSSGR